jgi:hypothetical protein
MLRSLERATTLIVALMLLVATSVLFFQQLTSKKEISSNDGRWGKVLARFGVHKKQAGVARTEHPDQRTLSEPSRLVLQNQGPSPAENTTPLGVQISGKAAELTLDISGLPKGMTLSAGRPFGTEAWRVPATELGNATIYPPPEFSGAVDLVVELRLSDGTVVDRGTMHREWLQRPTVAVTVAESRHSAVILEEGGHIATAPPEPVPNIAQQRPDPPTANRSDAREAPAINRVKVNPSVEQRVAAQDPVDAKHKRRVRSSVHAEASHTEATSADRNVVHVAGTRIGADPDVNVRMALEKQYSWLN